MTTSSPSFLVKCIVLSVGALLGAIIVVPVYFWYNRTIPGSSFQSIDELRSAMQVRDERDTKEDGSVSLRSIVRPHLRDDIIFTLQPHLRVRFQKEEVVTNSHGMRYREIGFEKPAKTIRIALMGDSFTFGWGVPQEYCFASLLEQKLNAAGLPQKFEVLNFGVPGYSTFQEVALYNELATKFSPDVVMFFVVDNDFGFPFFIGNGTLTPVSKENSLEEEKKGMLETIDANKALRRLFASLSDQQIPLYLTINPSPSYAAVKRKLWILKNEKGIHELSIRNRMTDEIKAQNIDPKDLSLPHDPHPSVRKHELLAHLIYEQFAKTDDFKKLVSSSRSF